MQWQDNLSNHICLVLPQMFKKSIECKQKHISVEAGALEKEHTYDNAANIHIFRFSF